MKKRSEDYSTIALVYFLLSSLSKTKKICRASIHLSVYLYLGCLILWSFFSACLYVIKVCVEKDSSCSAN